MFAHSHTNIPERIANGKKKSSVLTRGRQCLILLLSSPLDFAEQCYRYQCANVLSKIRWLRTGELDTE